MQISLILRTMMLALVLAAPLAPLAQAQSSSANGTVSSGYYDRHDGGLTQDGTPVPGAAWDAGDQ